MMKHTSCGTNVIPNTIKLSTIASHIIEANPRVNSFNKIIHVEVVLGGVNALGPSRLKRFSASCDDKPSFKFV